MTLLTADIIGTFIEIGLGLFLLIVFLALAIVVARDILS